MQEFRRYEESVKLCEGIELLLMSTEKVLKDNSCLDIKEDVKSKQLGKILGTKLQAQLPLCYLGKANYEDASETSNKAISQFIYDIELNR